MKTVLIVSGDVVDSSMGGVGVRNWELAHALAKHCRVTLAIPNETGLSSEKVRLISFNLEKSELKPLAQEADVILVHGSILHFHPYLRELQIPLAVDLYVPSLLESLVWHDQDDWRQWIPAYEEYLRVQLELLRAGDFFFCASERQRDYWLGWLHAQKRINPHTYRQDPTLRRLIDVVPFGLPQEPLVSDRPVLKGIHPGISPDDCLILWSGGLWDWLDPLTLIRAVAQVAPRHPELKLFFMGTRHPNPTVTGMVMPERAIVLSQELGIYNQQVFFGDWVPYQERVNYLAEADLAVVSHPGHIETHFSFRTRVLDCIWAGLPIIITEGDAMADWVEVEKLGFAVPVGDEEAMSAVIEQMLSAGGRAAFNPAFERMRELLRWDRVVRPLAQFCLNPSLAPDKSHYLTETERIGQDKEAFLQQVIQDKDQFLEQVVRDKDAYLEQILARNKDLENKLDRYRSVWLRRIFFRLKLFLGRVR